MNANRKNIIPTLWEDKVSMGRTSIKNKMMLSNFALLVIVMIVVYVVNYVAADSFLAHEISIILALISGIIFGHVFSRTLVQRLNNLIKIAGVISNGDLSKDIPTTSRDEVRDLEEVFAKMVSDLRSMIAEMKGVSFQINRTNEQLSNLTKKVVKNSQEIEQSARSIAEGSEHQTVITQKTSIQLDSGLTEMEEMVERSAIAVSKINEAYLKTEVGESNARQTLNHLENVLKQMVEHTQPMYRLATNIEKIAMIINVMDEIAQKTDILSLNASIESTRAGEAGRGFALVADEIRTMAENSKHSSQEIRDMIETILEDNKTVTESLDRSKAGINEGQETIKGVVGTFGEMLSGVKEIAVTIDEVQKVTSSQAEQMRGLLEHVNKLSNLASENFVSTQKTTLAANNQKKDMIEIAKSIDSLGRLSKRMLETQGRFKLD
jgi:methyl-accepting chemotaxis protein